jgi:uncharacterized protein (DUF58 family)
MLLIDVSGSGNFGTVVQQKQDVATELCAVLAFSAIQNNDKVGVIFFSDKIEKFIPPKKGRSHILMIIRELIDFTPKNKGTNVAEALRYFTSANKKHDVIALKLYDKHEEEFPDLGLIPMVDEETGELKWVNTGDKEVRNAYRWASLKRNGQLVDTFKKSGVDYTKIGTHESYIKPLMTLFKKRESRR